MSQFDIIIPTVGESVTEANIGRFIIAAGGWAEKGEAVLEIETDKASMEITAPESGVVQYTVGEGDLVSIGASVGSVDTAAEKPEGGAPPPPPSMEEKINAPEKPATPPPASAGAEPAPAFSEEQLKGLGPAKRKALREGRIQLPTAGGTSMEPPAPEVERKKMSVMRKKIAERLMNSQQSTASLTTFNEVDMTNVMATRNQLKNEFLEKNGVKLGFMSYFTKAVCHAAQEVPGVNAQIDGEEIVYNKNVHLSIAVSTDRGLVVPVLRSANKLSYAGIESGIGELAARGRDGKLGIEDMVGGTYTITNGGVFGSLVSTPILNPPQSAILGMHKIEQRPMAIDDGTGNFKIEIRPMMYLAMTYDHRLVDGKESVTFLVKVKEYLENVTVSQVV